MSNCILNMLKGICSFILGSLRMILFLGCMLFVLVQVMWILLLLHSDSHHGLGIPESFIGLRVYVHAILLLSLALLGCYGSFYKNHGCVKAFSLLTALNTAFLILMVLYTMGPDEIERENDKFVSRMQEFAKNYNWDHHHHNEATESWDIVQKLHCCGIKGPADWDKVRPDQVPSNMYPSSCCSSTNPDDPFGRTDLCSEQDGLFKTGCLEKIQQLEAMYLLAQCMFIAFQMGLCIIGCVVGNFTLHNCSNRNTSSNSNAGIRGVLPPSQGYQRFSGSVYVRQPPVNEMYQPKAPPMYPDVNSIEKTTTYNAPPPSYGSVH